jgi:hypothetical protein
MEPCAIAEFNLIASSAFVIIPLLLAAIAAGLGIIIAYDVGRATGKRELHDDILELKAEVFPKRKE